MRKRPGVPLIHSSSVYCILIPKNDTKPKSSEPLTYTILTSQSDLNHMHFEKQNSYIA